jgi:hypothetical protein
VPVQGRLNTSCTLCIYQVTKCDYHGAAEAYEHRPARSLQASRLSGLPPEPSRPAPPVGPPRCASAPDRKYWTKTRQLTFQRDGSGCVVSVNQRGSVPSRERICEIRCRSSSAIFCSSPLWTAGDTVHGQEGPHLKLVESMGDDRCRCRAGGAHRRRYGWFPSDEQCGRDGRRGCSYRRRV